MSNLTTISFTDGSLNLYDISGVIYQYDISGIIAPSGELITDISSIIVGTDVSVIGQYAFATFSSMAAVSIPSSISSIGSYAFFDCSALTNIIIDSTDNLLYIGSSLFQGINPVGIYTFNSSHTYSTPNVQRLVSMLPFPGWSSTIQYTYYVDCGILATDIMKINSNCNTNYVSLNAIDISYQDFHQLFFSTNRYFTLNYRLWNQPNPMSKSQLEMYTVLRLQSQDNSLLLIPDTSFSLLLTIQEQYQQAIPPQYWSVESSIQFNRKISQLKTIFDFHNSNTCNNACSQKNITLNEFFDMFEDQGVQFATDNSYNLPYLTAKGLPMDGSGNTFFLTAFLSLNINSHNNNVRDTCIRIPYNINFAGSMPKSATDQNNYRYNP